MSRFALVRDRSVRVRPVAGDERTLEREVVRLETAKRVGLAFSPGGERLAVAEFDIGRLSLWRVDPLSSRPERVLTRPNFDSWPVFAAPGTLIAWGSEAEAAVSLWDLSAPPDAAPRVVQRPDAERTVISVFDPHGSWLAVSHQDSVTFWAIAQPWPRVLARLGSQVQRLRFTSDSRRLVSCESAGVSVWPLDPAVAPARRRLSDGGCVGLSLTPDDRKVLWGLMEVQITSIEDGTGVVLVPVQTTPGRRHLSARRSTPRDAGAPRSPRSPVSRVRKKIRIGTCSRAAACASRPRPPTANPTTACGGRPLSVDFLADGRLIVGRAGGVRLLDPRTEESERAWELPPTEVAAVGVSADGRRAAAVRMPEAASGKYEGRGEIVFFHFATGERRSITTHGTRFGWQLALDATGSVLVSGGWDGAVRVGPSDGREPHLLCCHTGTVYTVAVSPDGKWIASAAGGEIRLWPMPDLTKPLLHTLPYDELMAKLRAFDEPAGRRGRGLAHRLHTRDRPLPRLEGRADMVRDHSTAPAFGRVVRVRLASESACVFAGPGV